MAVSLEKLVFEQLETKLNEITWANNVEVERFKLGVTDFRDSDIPAIQVIDAGMTSTPETRRNRKSWLILIQIILKSKSIDEVDQGDLFDRMKDVELKIGEDPTLGLNNPSFGTEDKIVHMTLVSRDTDTMSAPFYIGSLVFNVESTAPYTGVC